MTHLAKNIYALSSAPGRAGVAIVRISGPNILEAYQALCQKETAPLPRMLHFTHLYDAQGQIIDKAMIVYFQGPNSFTGEDCIELHLHGSAVILDKIYYRLSEMDGFRMAERGEFTQRAFEHGKLDLTEAEAIADLIDAETEMQHRQALRQLSGELGNLYQQWHDELKHALAYIEAMIDFSDEELPEGIPDEMMAKINGLKTEVDQHLNDAHMGEKIRQGFSIAIIGAPNAGKSTLLNRLAKSDVAIVTDQAGTTRDVIEIKLDIAGYPVVIADTAGIRDTEDLIESEGVKRALKKAELADLKLLVVDSNDHSKIDPAFIDERTCVIWNKSDLKHNPQRHLGECFAQLTLSAKFDEDLTPLFELLKHYLNQHYTMGAAPSLTRLRHREHLKEVSHFLAFALQEETEALIAENIRIAMFNLGKITGRVDVEDLLDVIFRDFCIGK